MAMRDEPFDCPCACHEPMPGLRNFVAGFLIAGGIALLIWIIWTAVK